MKFNVIAIVFLSFALLLLTSCGQALNDEKEGKAFALKFLKDVGVAWRADSISDRLDPAINTSDFQTILELFSEVIGPVKSVGELKVLKSEMGIGNKPQYTGEYHVPFEGQKEKASANLIVYKKKNKWYLYTFNVGCSAIENYKAEERKEACTASEKIVEQICTNWSSEYVESKASSVWKKSVKGNDLGVKGVLAAQSLAFGKLKEIIEGEPTTYHKRDGHDAFASLFKLQMARSKALMRIEVQKEDGEWKINGFDMKNYSGK